MYFVKRKFFVCYRRFFLDAPKLGVHHKFFIFYLLYTHFVYTRIKISKKVLTEKDFPMYYYPQHLLKCLPSARVLTKTKKQPLGNVKCVCYLKYVGDMPLCNSNSSEVRKKEFKCIFYDP